MVYFHFSDINVTKVTSGGYPGRTPSVLPEAPDDLQYLQVKHHLVEIVMVEPTGAMYGQLVEVNPAATVVSPDSPWTTWVHSSQNSSGPGKHPGQLTPQGRSPSSGK